MEVRKLNTKFKIRESPEADDGSEMITGYAAVTESEAPEQMGFVEKIAEGAFDEALRDSDVRALFNHDPNYILGRKSAGTLRLVEDDEGLYYEIDPPSTSYANDLMESLKRGDINESSFGFTVAEESWDESGEVPVRTIEKVGELFDVGPVTRGWYPQTDSGMKSKDEVLAEYRERKDKEQNNLEIYKKKTKLNQRSVF